MFPDACPILCGPGDVYVHNRLALHGAFPNTSADTRAVLHLGFNRRAAVLGVKSRTPQHKTVLYDEDFIYRRSRMIAWAIDARRQHYPDEAAFTYKPFINAQHTFEWSPDLKAGMYDNMACFENIIAI